MFHMCPNKMAFKPDVNNVSLLLVKGFIKILKWQASEGLSKSL